MTLTFEPRAIPQTSPAGHPMGYTSTVVASTDKKDVGIFDDLIEAAYDPNTPNYESDNDDLWPLEPTTPAPPPAPDDDVFVPADTAPEPIAMAASVAPDPIPDAVADPVFDLDARISACLEQISEITAAMVMFPKLSGALRTAEFDLNELMQEKDLRGVFTLRLGTLARLRDKRDRAIGIDPGKIARYEAEKKRGEDLKREALRIIEQATIALDNIKVQAASDPAVKAIEMEHDTYHGETQRWIEAQPITLPGVREELSKIKLLATKTPKAKTPRAASDGTPSQEGVAWSGPQAKALLEAVMPDAEGNDIYVLPRSPETAISLGDLYTRICESGALDATLNPGRVMVKILTPSVEAGSKYVRLCKHISACGFSLEEIPGSGDIDPKLTRIWALKTA